MVLKLRIENSDGAVLAQNAGDDRVCLVYDKAYNNGDFIVMEAESSDCYLVVQLEDSISPAFVFMGGHSHKMVVPFLEKRVSYSPKSFSGELHLLTVRLAEEREVTTYKNLALNPFDCHENICLFPHSSANVETRGEAVFAARNAVDGVSANAGHGTWPYQSWGINQNPDAQMRIEFGRKVKTDKAVITIRADFPHDSWWTDGILAFSDGSEVRFQLIKTDQPQTIEFESCQCEWVLLKNLIKADDDSPFPALSQIEIWGAES